MMEMFKGIDMVLKGTLDSDLEPPKQFYASDEFAHWKQVRPIHILDIGNLIGNNVIVGGRRINASK